MVLRAHDRPHRHVSFLLAALLAVPGCGRNGQAPARVDGQTTILVDNIHSIKQAPENGLPWNDFWYGSIHGQKRLFDFLAANGYLHRYATRAEAPVMTSEVLRGADILFVDLIAQHSLDFEAREIDTILDFVARGGGLLVVVDHTNVYDHARRCNPLLERLGVRTLYSTAMEQERPPHWEDDFWVVVRSFAPHPVTQDVRSIFLGTGAPLATEHGVAFLSPRGFADDWNPNRRNLSWVGNGKLDAGEATGALPVVAAGEHGRGRFVVLGDENMMGNSRLFLGDNFELVANVFEWLGRNEATDPPLRGRAAAPLRVGFDLEHCAWNIAGNLCEGYLPFFIDFNRFDDVLPRGLSRLEGDWDVLVFTDPVAPLGPEDLAFVRRHLGTGGTLLLLTDVARARAGTVQLLRELLPAVEFRGTRPFGVEALPAGMDLVAVAGDSTEFAAVSGVLDLAGARLSGHAYPPNARCGFAIESSRSYLRRVTATGGEALLQARVGTDIVDVARTYDVGGGRLVLFVQDGPFRNETLGWEQLPAGRRNEGSHRAVFELLRWLRTLHAQPTPPPP